jgi:hypothetical protein
VGVIIIIIIIVVVVVVLIYRFGSDWCITIRACAKEVIKADGL